jgi:hypothetical protein
MRGVRDNREECDDPGTNQKRERTVSRTQMMISGAIATIGRDLQDHRLGQEAQFDDPRQREEQCDGAADSAAAARRRQGGRAGSRAHACSRLGPSVHRLSAMRLGAGRM